MVYTDEVKQKIDNILKAFEDYIEHQDYFDIVFSKKAGYLWIVVKPFNFFAPELLSTPEKLLDELFNDIITDVVLSNGSYAESVSIRPLTESEETESRRRIAGILKTISGGDSEYLEYLDCYIKDYQGRYAKNQLPGPMVKYCTCAGTGAL